MNAPTVFTFNGTQVRILDIDGTPWWVLRDVCDVLGLSDVSMTASRLEADEKAETSLACTSSTGTVQNRPMVVVNESGLYAVILRSDKPEARAFRKWVTSEVLPAIRKTGAYHVAPALEGPMLLAHAVIEAAKMIEAKDAEIAELKPRAAVADAIALATDCKTISEVGKINGIGPRKLGDLLEAEGILFRTSTGDKVPYQPHIEAGRFTVKERIFSGKSGDVHRRSQTYVTGKGEVWIADRFGDKANSSGMART